MSARILVICWRCARRLFAVGQIECHHCGYLQERGRPERPRP